MILYNDKFTVLQFCESVMGIYPRVPVEQMELLADIYVQGEGEYVLVPFDPEKFDFPRQQCISPDEALEKFTAIARE